MDDTWDDVNGRYTDSGADSIIYDGMASMEDLGSRPRETDEAGQYVIVSTYRLNIPLSAALLKVDDAATVISSMRDPQMVGQTFRIMEHGYTTYAIQQSVITQLYAARMPR